MGKLAQPIKTSGPICLRCGYGPLERYRERRKKCPACHLPVPTSEAEAAMVIRQLLGLDP